MPKEFALILWDLHGNHHHHRALLVAKKTLTTIFQDFPIYMFPIIITFFDSSQHIVDVTTNVAITVSNHCFKTCFNSYMYVHI